MPAHVVAQALQFGQRSLGAGQRHDRVVLAVGQENRGVPVGAVALVLWGPFALTTLGVVLTLASGVYTLVFAELQYQGWRRIKA